MSTLPPRLRAALVVVMTAAVYVAVARFRVSLGFSHGTLALVSPPTGITLAAVLVWGPIALPGVILGSLITYIAQGWHPGFVVAATIGNALEATITAYLLRRVNVHLTFERVVDVARLVVFAAAGAVVAATIGIAALSATGAADVSSMRLWVAWCVSDVLGCSLVRRQLLPSRVRQGSFNSDTVSSNWWPSVS